MDKQSSFRLLVDIWIRKQSRWACLDVDFAFVSSFEFWIAALSNREVLKHEYLQRLQFYLSYSVSVRAIWSNDDLWYSIVLLRATLGLIRCCHGAVCTFCFILDEKQAYWTLHLTSISVLITRTTLVSWKMKLWLCTYEGRAVFVTEFLESVVTLFKKVSHK